LAGVAQGVSELGEAIAVLIKPCEMIEANLCSIRTMTKNNSDQFALLD
jgi:hypothetical protein